MGDLLELGTDQGIVKKSGAFYSYGDTRLGQGRENSKEFLTQHPEIAASLEARIRGHSQSQDVPAATEPQADDNDTGSLFATSPQTEETE